MLTAVSAAMVEEDEFAWREGWIDFIIGKIVSTWDVGSTFNGLAAGIPCS